MDKAKIKITNPARVITMTGGVVFAGIGEKHTVDTDEANRLIADGSAEAGDKEDKK